MSFHEEKISKGKNMIVLNFLELKKNNLNLNLIQHVFEKNSVDVKEKWY